MINPREITKFDRTDPELEEFLLFSILVAGKRSDVTARKLEEFLTLIGGQASPFDALRETIEQGELMKAMQACKLGKYNTLIKGLPKLVNSDTNLRTATPCELEQFKGIGLKTSRFFILHSRPYARVSALDTHILSFLREQGHEAPNTTPSSKRKYRALEQAFLQLADSAGKSVQAQVSSA